MSEPKKVRSNVDRLRRQLLASAGALSLYGAGVLTGKAFADAQNVYIEPKSFSGPYSYLIETDGTYVWAKDGKTGQVAYGGPNNAGGVSGTNASAVIQQAINALGAAGGKISIKKGIYNISSQINITEPCIIEGEGPDWFSNHGTYLETTNSINIFNFEFESIKYMPIVKHIQFSTNGGAAIRLGANVSDPIIEEVAAHGNGVGVLIDGAVNGWIRNCWLESDTYGVRITNGGSGFIIESNHFYNSATALISVENYACGLLQIRHNLCQRAKQRGFYLNLNDAYITDNIIDGVSTSAPNTYDAIYATPRGPLIISNNYITGSTARYGINVAGDNANARGIIEDNIFGTFATGPVNLVSYLVGVYRVRNNIGYYTDYFKTTGLSVPVGTGGAYGSASEITSLSWAIAFPKTKITWGGIFNTGETVTVKVEAVYTDGITAYVEKSATAVGSLWLTDDDVLSLITQGKDIVKLKVYAKSSATSTSVTVTVDAYGKA